MAVERGDEVDWRWYIGGAGRGRKSSRTGDGGGSRRG